MNAFNLILICLLTSIGCAKVAHSGRPGPDLTTQVHVDGSRELESLTLERNALVRMLRETYRLDVTAPVSVWSCCGVPWARYVDRDLATIDGALARILAISRRQAELTATDPKLDAEAHRTAVLQTQLKHQRRAID